MKHRISEVGARMLKYQEQLARDYGYKPIPRTFFCDVRAEFQKALPKWCNVSGDTISLETADGIPTANNQEQTAKPYNLAICCKVATIRASR